jgi:hypothetical protein
LAALVASLVCLLSLTASEARHRAVVASTGAGRTDAGLGAPSSAPAFRLGTAAQPLGWATAVGDFNTDGTPDLVIADHASARSGAYAYRIQFSVSGVGAHNFAFESSQAAVTVRVSDVDHDNDLDVVVHAAASREVVGVWLNDGHGRFQPTDVRQFGSSVEPLTFASTSEPGAPSGRCELPPRRTAELLVPPVSPGPAVSSVTVSVAGPSLHQPLRLSPAALRGPPFFFL